MGGIRERDPEVSGLPCGVCQEVAHGGAASEAEFGGGGVESADEFGHGSVGFVAHVRDAERGAFDFAVAAVDGEVEVFFEGGDEGGGVDFAGIVDTGEGFGAEAVWREVSEAVAVDPVVDEPVETGVASEASVEAFGEDFVEFGFEGVDERDDRRARGHEVFRVFAEFDEVEVVAAVLHGGGAFEGAVAGGEEGHAWWEGEGFLDAEEHDIEAEIIEGDGDRGERADGVGDEEDFRVFSDDLGDFAERVEDPGGGFGVDDGDGVETALGESGVDGFRGDGLAPWDAEGFGLFTAGEGDIVPFVGEGTAAAVEDLFGDEVADAAFHDAPCGGSGDEDWLGGDEELLEHGHDAPVEILEVLGAVADHGLGHGGHGGGADFDWAGDEEFGVGHGGEGEEGEWNGVLGRSGCGRSGGGVVEPDAVFEGESADERRRGAAARTGSLGHLLGHLNGFFEFSVGFEEAEGFFAGAVEPVFFGAFGGGWGAEDEVIGVEGVGGAFELFEADPFADDGLVFPDGGGGRVCGDGVEGGHGFLDFVGGGVLGDEDLAAEAEGLEADGCVWWRGVIEDTGEVLEGGGVVAAAERDEGDLETGFEAEGPVAFMDLFPEGDGVVFGFLAEGEEGGFTGPEESGFGERVEGVVLGEGFEQLAGCGEVLAAELHFAELHAEGAAA